MGTGTQVLKARTTLTRNKPKVAGTAGLHMCSPCAQESAGGEEGGGKGRGARARGGPGARGQGGTLCIKSMCGTQELVYFSRYSTANSHQPPPL